MCSHCKLQQHTTTKRKGEINHGIKGPESIADPMNRMPLMALIVADLPVGLNRERLKHFLKSQMKSTVLGFLTHRSGDV
nr:hypothetical protein CFP56_67539 [Quercus suber]